MYQDILLPTDGSEASRSAVKHAEEIANKFDARIHVLFVVNASTLPDQMATGVKMEQMIATGREVTESIKEELDAPHIKTTVETGMPHRAIKKYTEEEDIDLVTMGSHGRSGLNRMLLGSVTEKVLRTVEIPVLTAKNE